jgi:hypothetical protein
MEDRLDLEVFDRIRLAIQAAKREEDEFAAKKSAENPLSAALMRAFIDWSTSAYVAGRSLRPSAELRRLMADELEAAVDDNAASAVARLPFVRPYLDIRLAEDGLNRAEEGSERLIELLDYLVGSSLSRRAEDYLSRVAGLYNWGFDAEAVVLAGAVLETALHDRLAEDDAQERSLNLTSSSAASLVEACGPKKLGLFDDRLRRQAHRLRQSRNDIVHNAAGSQLLTPVDAIRSLGELLSALFPQSQQ